MNATVENAWRSRRPAIPADTSLELSAREMRDLLDAVRDRVVEHVASLPAQPAADVAGSEELARALFEAEPPEAGIPAAEILDLLFDARDPEELQHGRAGIPGLHPRRGRFRVRRRRPDLGRHESLRRRLAGGARARPARDERRPLALRDRGASRGERRVPRDGGLARHVHGRRRGAAGEAPGRLPEGDALRLRPDAPRRLEGRVARGVPGGERPLDSVRREVPPSRRPACRADRGGPGRRPHAVLRLRERRDDEHGGRRRPRRARESLCGRAALVPRRRGLRRLLPPDRSGAEQTMAGIERADSVVLDPHKGLFLPYGTGALLVRDAEVLRRAHAAGADYLPHMQEDPGFVDYCEISPELSRAFRGLRVWLPLKLHGLGAFRRNLDEKLDLALHATRELRTMPGIEIVAEPQLSIVAFRLVRPGLDVRGAEPPEPRPDRAGERATAGPRLGDGPRRRLRSPDLRPLVPDAPREARGRPRGHPRGDAGGLSRSGLRRAPGPSFAEACAEAESSTGRADQRDAEAA